MKKMLVICVLFLATLSSNAFADFQLSKKDVDTLINSDSVREKALIEEAKNESLDDKNNKMVAIMNTIFESEDVQSVLKQENGKLVGINFTKADLDYLEYKVSYTPFYFRYDICHFNVSIGRGNKKVVSYSAPKCEQVK
ncbi:MAG: hypothetical protein ACOYOK_04320 [Pseudobdellovibrionaceae bacterium]